MRNLLFDLLGAGAEATGAVVGDVLSGALEFIGVKTSNLTSVGKFVQNATATHLENYWLPSFVKDTIIKIPTIISETALKSAFHIANPLSRALRKNGLFKELVADFMEASKQNK